MLEHRASQTHDEQFQNPQSSSNSAQNNQKQTKLAPPTGATSISGLFVPINKIFPKVHETNGFTPGTPVTSRKTVSYDVHYDVHDADIDRRTSAASLWGVVSPRVSVWERRLQACGRRY